MNGWLALSLYLAPLLLCTLATVAAFCYYDAPCSRTRARTHYDTLIDDCPGPDSYEYIP